MTNHQEKNFDTPWLIVKSLYRASVLGFLIVTLYTPLVFMSDQIYPIHNAIISVDRLTYNAMMFEALIDMKTMVVVFLFLPAMGLHWTLRKEQAKPKQASSS
jgi:hypothetical protein